MVTVADVFASLVSLTMIMVFWCLEVRVSLNQIFLDQILPSSLCSKKCLHLIQLIRFNKCDFFWGGENSMRFCLLKYFLLSNYLNLQKKCWFVAFQFYSRNMAAIIKFILSQCSFSVPLEDVRKPKCSFFMTRKWYTHACILIALSMIYVIDEILWVF